MKRYIIFTILIALVLVIAACATQKKYHSTDMPDPQAFNAHFGDMDANGDDLVSGEEFAAHFQNADRNVFNAVDLNQDSHIDHDEWHEFKKAHGLKHREY
jgi:hypothetical protein